MGRASADAALRALVGTKKYGTALLLLLNTGFEPCRKQEQMKISTALATIPLLAGVAFSQGTQLPFACGAEGQRACNGSDPEYNVYYYQRSPTQIFSGQACDRGLVAINNICVGGPGLSARYQFNPNVLSSWVRFNISDKMFGSQTDTPINWITTFGTHDSFSNYIDGSFSPLNGDQQLSITDQLIAGARSIRMDPVGYAVAGVSSGFPFPAINDTQLRMCHQSAGSNTGTAAECAVDSYGRLFGYGLEEVKHWLNQNPGEVLTIRMYRMQQSDVPEITNEITKIIGQPLILTPPCTLTQGPNCFQPYPVFWDPTLKGWPTLRQMRAMGKRVIFLSDIPTSVSYKWNDWVENDAYTDDPTHFNANSCANTGGNDVRQREFNVWSYIGEDRSVSNAYGASPGKGTMDPDAVKVATDCGFSIVSLDFLYAGSFAPNLNFQVPSVIPVFGGATFSVNYTFPDPDTRFVSTIWNWTHAPDGSTGDSGDNGPVFVAGNGDWTSAPGAFALPFACAIDGGSILSPIATQWTIARNMGPWANGYAACQAIGARYWAPQSALDSYYLSLAVDQYINTGGTSTHAWVNFQKTSSPVLTPSICPATTDGSCPMAGAYTAGTLPANGFSISFMGGKGGALSYAAIHGSGAKDLLLADGNIDYAAKTLHFNWTPEATSATLAPGVYQQVLEVTELDPQAQANVVQQVTFTLTIQAPAETVTVTANIAGPSISADGGAPVTMPHVFNWHAGEFHTIAAVSPTNPSPGVQTALTSWSTGATTKSISYKVPAQNSQVSVKFADSYALTLSAVGSGTLTPSPAIPASGYYPQGTKITITAAAGANFTFNGFTGFPKTMNPAIVSMDQPMSVTANFVPLNTAITIGSNQTGLTLIADGVAFQGTKTFSWAAGSTHQLDASQPAPAAGIKAQFQQWSDSPSAARSYVVPATAATLTASFSETYLLNIGGSPTGSISVSPASPTGYYNPGQTVTVTAAPNAGYSFVSFSGALSGSANPQTILMNQPAAIGANFVKNVSISFTSNVAGQVYTIQADGVNVLSTSQLSWTPGSSHTLSIPSPQAAGPNQRFVSPSWQGFGASSQISVAPNSNMAYNALFSTQYQVSANISPAGAGQVSGTGWYTAGTNATLVASANSGETFTGYTGGVTGAGNSITFAVNGPVAAVANFVAAAPDINITLSAIPGTNSSQVLRQAAFRNSGKGPATGVTIDGATIVATSGTGKVTMTVPIAVGDIPANSTATVPLTIAWPVTATKITLTLHYTGNGGALQNTQQFNLSR